MVWRDGDPEKNAKTRPGAVCVVARAQLSVASQPRAGFELLGWTSAFEEAHGEREHAGREGGAPSDVCLCSRTNWCAKTCSDGQMGRPGKRANAAGTCFAS